MHASDVVESGQVVDAPRDVGVLGSPRTPNPRGKPPRMAHRQPADILRDLEATATITDAAERFPKLNVLQHEAIAAARTNEALYAQVNERAEALAQQAIDQITRIRRDQTGR